MKKISIIISILFVLGIVAFFTVRQIYIGSGGAKDATSNYIHRAEAAEVKMALVEIRSLEEAQWAQANQYSDSFKTLGWAPSDKVGVKFQVGLVQSCDKGGKGIVFANESSSEDLAAAVKTITLKYKDQCVNLKSDFIAVGLLVAGGTLSEYSADSSGSIKEN